MTVARRPARIVSLSPTATEMLYAVGAGSQVVAVDKDSDYPSGVPKTDLDPLQINTEAVAGFRPDLVVGSGLSAQQRDQLGRVGVTVLDEPAATTLQDTYRQITDLGTATGHTAQATTVVTDVRDRLAKIVAETPKPRAGTTYYYELDQTLYSVTSATFVGQLMHTLGLTSIADAASGAAAAGGYPQLSAEYVLKAQPTYVFLADQKCCGQSAASVAARPGWSVLGAVKAGRVTGIDDDIASRWGPRVVELVQAVSDELRAHPVS